MPGDAATWPSVPPLGAAVASTLLLPSPPPSILASSLSGGGRGAAQRAEKSCPGGPPGEGRGAISVPSWAWVGLGLRVGRGLCSGARSVLHVVAKIFAFVTVKVASAPEIAPKSCRTCDC